jgi:PAS domain S-box-containing protein
VQLRWVETGTSSDEAFRKGLVDLWPLMANLPERRKHVHFTRPWLHSSHALLLRSGSAPPDGEFTGRIALFKMPLHVRLVREQFPKAQLAEFPEGNAIVKAVCKGTAAAGFLEGRVAAAVLREEPAECASMVLRVQMLPGLKLQHAVASTFEAAGAAESIRREIGNMFRDGTLAGLIAKYSYYGLEDSWASYDLMESAERWRWAPWIAGVVGAALVLILWQAGSLRQRKREELLLRESERRFRIVADTAPVMIWVAGPDKLCSFFNKIWLDFTGRTMEQELGNGWAGGVHPEDLDRCWMTFHSSFDEQRGFQMEYRLRRADGEYRWILDNGVPHFNHGQFAGYIGSCVDVTEQKQSEAALRESEERFRNMADTAPVMIWVAGPDKGFTFINKTWLDFTGRAMEE